MKILHVITSLNDGGAEKTLFQLCAHSSHHHCVISLSQGGKYGTLLKKENIRVIELSIKERPLYSLRLLIKEFRNRDYDSVQTWLSHANLIGGILTRIFSKKPIFWNVRHEAHFFRNAPIRSALLSHTLAVLSFIIPTRIIYCAKTAKHTHEALGYSRKKGVCIQNGVNLDKFHPSVSARNNFRADKGIEENEFVIGVVGRYSRVKNHTLVIEAANELRKSIPNFKILFVGEGITSPSNGLKRIIDKKDLTKHFYLINALSDIHLVMKSLDLLVLPSKSEGFPNVVVEAMASGTLCVSANVGDAGLIIDNFGWIVDDLSPKTLSDEIIKAYCLKQFFPIYWRKKSENSRAHAQKTFSISKMVDRYTNLWASYAKGGNEYK